MNEKMVWIDCYESGQGQLRVFAIYKTKKSAEKAGMVYQMPLSEAEKYLKREKGRPNPFRV
jgi:hypothetical protein